MPLNNFNSVCKSWFEKTYGTPTAAQIQAWPAIQSGRHTLISAPTGSGKTLAAFYAVIDRLLHQGLENSACDGVQIVYVSPLKALSNDIHKNLEVPLDGIAEELHNQGMSPVDIRAAVRTGDTPQNERQKMIRNPPHILVTTPESLYLLLTSAGGRNMLRNVSTVIVDEIHAMLGDKRGAHLALSLERLANLVNGGLQRIGLSATQKPIEAVAKFLTGNNIANNRDTTCTIVDTGHRREIDINLNVPKSPLSAIMSNEVWDELYERLVELIETHDTTLVFVNTRRLSERLALALTERLGKDSVCAHHGSMSKDHRLQAEQRLKEGGLKVLVATASMELGIDVGAIDLVVQFSSPKSIATLLQRVGRSGHTVGGIPKGILFPLTRDELIECTALLSSIKRGELDQIVFPEKPLDILCQQIVAEVSAVELETTDSGLDVDALYNLFRGAYSYRELQREEFVEILQMLGEGYTTRRGRRGAHLHYDQVNNRVRSRRGSGLIALTNGGAIPDMFDYQVVLDPEDVVVGSLNEDFALEALPGDVFTLGTHAWQLLRIDGLKVRVRDAHGMSPTIPFWLGEGPGRTRELSESVSTLRGKIACDLDDLDISQVAEKLVEELGIPGSAATQLVEYLHGGYTALGDMPTRKTIVMERFFDEVGDMHVVIHSPYGSRVNRAWGLALRKRFCRTFNFELQAAANEDSIVISLGSVHSFVLEDVFHYLQSKTVRDVLVQALLDAPMFEVRWRWNATRALAIQRNRAGKRVPPQFQRMDAEDLVAHVFPDQIACFENIQGKREVPDHPLVNQTILDCLTEAMDIGELTELLIGIEEDRFELIAKDLREPSPFAQEIINARPYAFLDDAPFEERRTNAIKNRSWLDPAEAGNLAVLDPEAIRRVSDEAWPQVTNVEELHDALLTLGYITAEEIKRHSYARFLPELSDQNRVTEVKSVGVHLWIAAERIPCFIVLYPDASLSVTNLPDTCTRKQWQLEDACREVVRGRLEGLGPVTASQLVHETSWAPAQVQQALVALEIEGYAFQGNFAPTGAADPAIQWCERRLLQRIHRYTIDVHRKAVKPVSLQSYTRFLFDLHQIQPQSVEATQEFPRDTIDGQTALQSVLGIMDGIAAPAVAWEADIIPARIKNYDPNWLDVMCISGRTIWGRLSAAPGRTDGEARKAGPVKTTPIVLASRENLDIWQILATTSGDSEANTQPGHDAAILAQHLHLRGASFFSEIQRHTGLLRAQLETGLGELVSLGMVSSDSFTGLRALLTPADRKPGRKSGRSRRAMFGIEDAGRWALLHQPPANRAENQIDSESMLDNEELERLVRIYLQRWGVVFRRVLEREAFAPPWRVLVRVLRRMELQGKIRGGRFIAGVGGEQFAYPETIDSLRRISRQTESLSGGPSEYTALAAVDPANLLYLVYPETRLPRVPGNRVLFRNGIPVAILKSGQVTFLASISPEQQWLLQQLLLQRQFPARLRSYLGNKNPATVVSR